MTSSYKIKFSFCVCLFNFPLSLTEYWLVTRTVPATVTLRIFVFILYFTTKSMCRKSFENQLLKQNSFSFLLRTANFEMYYPATIVFIYYGLCMKNSLLAMVERMVVIFI